MSFSEYMMSSTGNPIVDAEKYTNKPVSIDEAGKCIQTAKIYTREELVEVIRSAAQKYPWTETMFEAQIKALEAIDAVKIKGGE